MRARLGRLDQDVVALAGAHQHGVRRIGATEEMAVHSDHLLSHTVEVHRVDLQALVHVSQTHGLPATPT